MVDTEQTERVGYYAKATVRGVFQKTPAFLRAKPPKDTPFCEVTIQVDEQEIIVRGEGNMASQLASVPPGSNVVIRGKLERHPWKTGNKTQCERTIVRAQALVIEHG